MGAKFYEEAPSLLLISPLTAEYDRNPPCPNCLLGADIVIQILDISKENPSLTSLETYLEAQKPVDVVNFRKIYGVWNYPSYEVLEGGESLKYAIYILKDLYQVYRIEFERRSKRGELTAEEELILQSLKIQGG